MAIIMAAVATYIHIAFQFNEALWHPFPLDSIIFFFFLSSKCIIISQCSHLNKECVAYCVGLNVHKKCRAPSP